MPTDNETLQFIREALARQSEQIKTIFNRLDENAKLTESVHKLATSVELLASSQKQTEKKVDALSDDVEEIRTKPAKRMDGVTSVIVTAVITAIITFVLTHLGLK